MDLSTLVGLVVGFVALVYGMILKGVQPGFLIIPAALLIILGGTIATVIIGFPMNELKKVPKLFGKIFGNPKGITNKQAIDLMTEFAEAARKDGLLALEQRVYEIKDPFMRRGMEMLVDGSNADLIETTMLEDISAMEDRHASGAQIFSQAGTYAPTLGVLGAVVGLISSLGNLEDTGAVAHAISAAFVATVWGIFTGYVLWHPFANKLKRKSKQEVLTKHLILSGILALSVGTNPRMLLDKMLSYLPAKERESYRVSEKEE